MNREIKFKGKCAFSGVWRYGYFYISKGNYIIRDSEGKESIFLKDSVCQFTGLKDKNGVDIYEGDIVKWTLGRFFWQAVIKTVENNRSSTLYAIETIHNCSTDESGEKYTYEISNSRNGFRNEIEYLSKVVEVIGNIH